MKILPWLRPAVAPPAELPAPAEEAAKPARSESVREFLLRTPHVWTVGAQGLGWSASSACACGEPMDAPVHEGRDLLMTARWLDQREAVLEAGRRRACRPWDPDGPHEFTEDDEDAGVCECGAPVGDWRHREVPAEAGPASAGWLADGPGDSPAAVRAPEQEPETVPLRKPPPLPGGVLGYVVVLRGESRSMLTDADMRPSLEAAQADADAQGKRPGWAGRAVACEVREVSR